MGRKGSSHGVSAEPLELSHPCHPGCFWCPRLGSLETDTEIRVQTQLSFPKVSSRSSSRGAPTGWAAGSQSPWGPLGMHRTPQNPILCLSSYCHLYLSLLMVGVWVWLPRVMAEAGTAPHELSPPVMRGTDVRLTGVRAGPPLCSVCKAAASLN